MPLPRFLLPAMLLLACAAAPARAGTQELRLGLARLIETLDAGLTRADLRTLRIEIGAEIRVQKLYGMNTLADIDDVAKALTAADQVWTILLGLPACQPAPAGGTAPAGTVADPAACTAQITPQLQVLGLTPPEAGTPINQAGVIQPVLQALRRQAERVLRNLR
ncbi:MAG: hypothetical protein ACOYOH_09555 [Paracraurococcus sp.]